MKDRLVLVPGIDGTGLLFYRQIPALSRNFDVTSTRHRDEARSMEDLVDDLDRAIAAVSPERKVTLLGESFGGALTLSYALARPERVERIIIVNSFAHFGSPARLWLGYHLLRATPWGMMRIVRQLTARRMHSPQTERDEIRRFHDLMRATTRQGYLSRMRILCDYDIRDRLPSLSVPALFLAADRDTLVPSVEQAKLMSDGIPGAKLRVLEGHGHICLIAPGIDLGCILDEWSPTARSPLI